MEFIEKFLPENLALFSELASFVISWLISPKQSPPEPFLIYKKNKPLQREWRISCPFRFCEKWLSVAKILNFDAKLRLAFLSSLRSAIYIKI
jgi:hypothetical protein